MKIIEDIEGLGGGGQAGVLAGQRACVRAFGKLKGMKGIDGIAMASNKFISSFGGGWILTSYKRDLTASEFGGLGRNLKNLVKPRYHVERRVTEPASEALPEEAARAERKEAGFSTRVELTSTKRHAP